jgi:hypothetical protein
MSITMPILPRLYQGFQHTTLTYYNSYFGIVLQNMCMQVAYNENLLK